MNKKVKLLLGTVSLICLLSLVCNGVSLRRNNSSAWEDMNSVQMATIDSLKSVVQKRDSVIGQMQADVEKAKTAAVNSNTELGNRVKTLEREKATLSKQIADKTVENKNLRKEIDDLKAAKETSK